MHLCQDCQGRFQDMARVLESNFVFLKDEVAARQLDDGYTTWLSGIVERHDICVINRQYETTRAIWDDDDDDDDDDERRKISITWFAHQTRWTQHEPFFTTDGKLNKSLLVPPLPRSLTSSSLL